MTQTNTMMGSPLYMSPEQILSPKQVNYRTDIYSLGVSLYFMLSGTKPYNDTQQSIFSIQTDIVHKPLPRLPFVSDNTNDAIQKATQKDPANRYESCTAFAVALTSSEPASIDVETPTLIAPLHQPMTVPDQVVDTPVRSDAGEVVSAQPAPAETNSLIGTLIRWNEWFMILFVVNTIIKILYGFAKVNSPDDAFKETWKNISNISDMVAWSVGLVSLSYYIAAFEGYPTLSISHWLTNYKEEYPRGSNVHRLLYALIVISILYALGTLFTNEAIWFSFAQVGLNIRLYYILRKAPDYSGLLKTFVTLNASLIFILVLLAIFWAFLLSGSSDEVTTPKVGWGETIIDIMDNVVLSVLLIVMNARAIRLYKAGKPLPDPVSVTDESPVVQYIIRR